MNSVPEGLSCLALHNLVRMCLACAEHKLPSDWFIGQSGFLSSTDASLCEKFLPMVDHMIVACLTSSNSPIAVHDPMPLMHALAHQDPHNVS